MHRFVHNENLKRFQELLAKESDPAKRAQIERLIAEEEARDPNFAPQSETPDDFQT